MPFSIGPELRAPAEMPVDIHVRLEQTPCKLLGALHQFTFEDIGITLEVDSHGDVLIHTASARYYVIGGHTVLIDADPTLASSMMRYMVLSYCLPTLINQRGVQMALHANAIYTPRGAIILAGASGGGKSTLHAALLRRGMPMLSDDVAVLQNNAGGYAVLPGMRRYRITTDAWERLQPPADKVVPLGGPYNKMALLAPASLMHKKPAPLAAIYVLEPHDGGEIFVEKLQGVAAFHLLQTQAYLPLGSMVLSRDMLAFSNLVDHTAVYRVRRPIHRWTVDELTDIVLSGDPLSDLATHG